MNTIGWRQRLAHLRGSPVTFDVRPYARELAEINRLGIDVEQLSNGELETRARALRLRAGDSRLRSSGATGGQALESIRAEFFALARDASRRAIGLRPFDVQLFAALALDCGHIVEMQTGEGKTLAAVMPAALRALTGQGAHVLTFNDYLARRDAEWMGPVYAMLGLSVGFIQQGMPPEERRRAYLADVTYVTAKEAGFDHLRDLLAIDPRSLVHRPFHFALVDEADSILIDEARVPLVIAGSVGRDISYAPRLAALLADPRTTPEVDLLWFHHLPWSYRMASGRTLWEELVSRYDDGVASVERMRGEWDALRTRIDPERWDKTAALLAIEERDARLWRDASIAYWMSVNGLPLPAGAAPPEHDLAWYKALAFPYAPGNP